MLTTSYEDLFEIDSLAKKVIDDMELSKIPQWHHGYPMYSHFKEDIDNGGLYVYKEDNVILGTITILKENDPPYKTIDSWLKDKSIVIHRMLVDPSKRNKGIAQKLLNKAIMIGKERNYQSIKIDTHLENYKMRNFLKKNGFKLQLGMGFSHQSNGHTRLPNLGINTPMISLSGQIYNNKKDNYISSQRVKRGNISPKNYFITLNQSIGIHEQDETEGPKMGELKPVYSTDISAAILFNQHLKLRGGFTYRFYQQYYDHIVENQVDELIDNPKWSSSNVSFYLGNEFLMAHVAIDFLLGVNLHKPFYGKFNQGIDVGLSLQKTLLTRIGLNLYLINTHKLPKHNLFVGAHIKANMAKADYTDITIGYTFNLN